MSTTRPADVAGSGEQFRAPVAEAVETQTAPNESEAVPTYFERQRDEPSKRTYDLIKRRWSKIDSLDVVAMPFEDRVRYAQISQRDAEFCKALRLHPRTTSMPEFAQFFQRCLNTEVDLRMGALVLAPELMNETTVDNLVEVGMELSGQLGPGSERDFNSIDKLSKIHDIQALEALWMARSAVTQAEKVAAKTMLGDSIAESMREIVSLAKRIEQASSRMDKHALGNPGGILAEFMLVTWERLNLYMASHEDIDVLGRVFIRSSLDREDKLAPDKDRSIDAVIMNLDRSYIRPQQYKSSSKGTREYDRQIEVVRIPDWRAVMDNISDVAWAFNIILSQSSNGPAKEQARQVLNGYFDPARVAKVTR